MSSPFTVFLRSLTRLARHFALSFWLHLHLIDAFWALLSLNKSARLTVSPWRDVCKPPNWRTSPWFIDHCNFWPKYFLSPNLMRMAVYDRQWPYQWPVQLPTLYYVCATKMVLAAVVFLCGEPDPKSMETFLLCKAEANSRKGTSFGVALAQSAHRNSLVPIQRFLKNHQIWKFWRLYHQWNFWTKKLLDPELKVSGISG